MLKSLKEGEEYALKKENKAAKAKAAAADVATDAVNDANAVIDGVDGAVGEQEKKGFMAWFKNETSKYEKGKFLLLLMIPGVLFYATFLYWPFYGILAAFKKYNPAKGIFGSPWADNHGFAEFIRFFTIPDVWNYVWNTIVLSILHIVWLFPLAILLALFINELRGAKFKKTVQTVSYLPHFVSVAAVAGMLALFLASQETPAGSASLANEGIINQFLLKMHIIDKGIPFLQRTEWFRTVYIASDVWQGIGWSAIIYIAALSAVDQELYEAATIDGATRLQKMWHISLQLIRPTIVILLVMQIGKIMSLGADKALLLQQPATYKHSQILSTYIYNQGLKQGEISFSTAVGLFNSIINVLLVITANFVSRKLTDTGLW